MQTTTSGSPSYSPSVGFSDTSLITTGHVLSPLSDVPVENSRPTSFRREPHPHLCLEAQSLCHDLHGLVLGDRNNCYK